MPTETGGLSLIPSHEVIQQHLTESPTRRENNHDDGQEEFDFLFNAEGKYPYQPFKSLQRRALPDGKSCPSASMSSVVCCSSLSSNNDDGTFGAPCYPSLHGGAFERGMPCEAASWAKNNDPWSYDPNICNFLLSLTSDNTTAGSTTSFNGNITDNEGEEGKEVEVSILSLWGDRRYLPDGMSCSDLTDRTQCCKFLDNRIEKGDMYHGQPCVAVQHGSNFPNGGGGAGVCETANFVAEHFPGSAIDCADAALRHPEQEHGLYLLSTLTQQEMGLDDYLKELQTQILLSRQSPVTSIWNRTLLALDQPCQAISDPLVCCAARQTEQVCMVTSTNTIPTHGNNKGAKQPSWMLGGLDGKPSSRAQSRSRRRTSSCLPRPTRKLDSSRTINAAEIEISSHDTSIPFTSLGSEQEFVGSMATTSWNANNSSNENGDHDDEDDHDDDDTLPAGDHPAEHYDDDDPCEVLVHDELLRRSPVKECTSLKQVRSCCSAMEFSTTQPCVFVVDQGCTSMAWLISNLAHNATVIVDCAGFLESDAPLDYGS